MFDNTKLVNRTSFLIACLAVGIIIFSLVNYVIKSWFLVDKIVVIGDFSRLNVNSFKVATQDRLYGNLFTIDIDGLQDDFKKIPWVKDVSVMRRFPHTIEINLTEYNTVARLSETELITPDGKVFLGTMTQGESLPLFNTQIKNSREALSDYKLLKPILDKRNLRLIELKINGTGITEVVLSNNLEITICGTDFAHHIAKLDKYWDKLYKLNPHLKTINMCYHNRVAINSYKKESSVSAADGVMSNELAAKTSNVVNPNETGIVRIDR